MLDAIIEASVVMPRATVVGMTSNTCFCPGWVMNDEATPGGFAGGQWIAEGALAAPQVGTMRNVTLTARKFIMYSDATNELLADSQPSFAGQLRTILSGVLAAGLDASFIRGDGVAKPLGILNAPSTPIIHAEAMQTAYTVNIENILNLYSRMMPSSVNNAVWIINPSVTPSLYKLAVTFEEAGATVGGSLAPVFQGNTLMGRPIHITSRASAIGDVGDVIFVDLSKYSVGLRKEIWIATRDSPLWYRDITSFRISTRVDGTALMDLPQTMNYGPTTSWCVTLAAR